MGWDKRCVIWTGGPSQDHTGAESMPPHVPPAAVRLDKWLWAARFAKTRSAATEAVNGGKVTVNDESVKPARLLKVGDMVRVRVGAFTHDVAVTALAERRGSAEQAAKLYEETAASLAQRERQRELMALAPSFEFERGKPSKKDRRAMDRLRGRGE